MRVNPIVYVADAGSVSKGNFHWVSPASNEEDSDKIEELAVSIVSQLEAGRKVALGYESPLFVPLPKTSEKLGKSRDGECTPETGNRPFNAGAGASLFATGIQSLVWVLNRIKCLRPVTTASTSLVHFRSGDADMLVWEAFVSGSEKAKPPCHVGDAKLAMEAFNAAMQSDLYVSAIRDEIVFSLVGAAILRAGLSNDLTLLRQPCLVLRPLRKEAPDA